MCLCLNYDALVSRYSDRCGILLLLLLSSSSSSCANACTYDRYVGPSERVSFFVVAKRAQALSHIVLGYQTKSNLEDLYINPKDKAVPK